MSTAPAVCTMVWPFLGEGESAGGDTWLIGWNPRGLVVVIATIVRNATIEDALHELDKIRSLKDGTCVKHQWTHHEDVPGPASLSILGRLRASSDGSNMNAEGWVHNERRVSDIWLELRRGPVLDQVWCCGYHVQACHLHVIRTDARVRYAAVSTVFSATTRFGCSGVSSLMSGKKALCVMGVQSALEGVLLPPHMVSQAGPCARQQRAFDNESQTHNFRTPSKKDQRNNNSPDDPASLGKGTEHCDVISSAELELWGALPPRLDFPTSVHHAELSFLLRANECARMLRESLGGQKAKCHGQTANMCRHNGNISGSKDENEGRFLYIQSFLGRYLSTFVEMLIKFLLAILPILTWFGKISSTTALLEFRVREFVHWLAVLQGHTKVCGLHPILPHMQHEDPAFRRFCTVNFLVRLVADGILGISLSLLFAFGGNALIHSLWSFCRCILFDFHMGYIDWFEGWPAGLKMNGDLNMTLCFFAKLVLRTCCESVVSLDRLEFFCKMVVHIAPFGASFAFAFFSDFCLLVSLHLLFLFQAISVPYRVMFSVMGNLFLHFRGKKYNPLRRRTDAYDFEAYQMLMGTLLFTIIVFCFPTVAVYYLYFALAYAFLLMLHEGLVATAHITLYLPVYPLVYWLVNRRKWPGGITITAPKVTCMRHHATAASTTPTWTSTTVEVTVLSKPLELRVFLTDFLLVLWTLAKRCPSHTLAIIFNARQVRENTSPIELLIPHLQRDCVRTKKMNYFSSSAKGG